MIILDIGYTVVKAQLINFYDLPQTAKYVVTSYYDGTKHKHDYYDVYVDNNEQYFATHNNKYRGYSVECYNDYYDDFFNR